jgi:hypothetical protein
MATLRMPILGWNAAPDTSGDVFLEPYPIKATNDRWDHLHFIFNDTATKISLFGMFTVPKNYVGTPQLVIVWTTTATSGDVEWDFAYRAVGGDDAESLDQTSQQEDLNQNDTAPSAANERMEVAINLTAANLAADDNVEFELSRDGTDAGDTIAAAVQLVGLYFQYADA